MTLVAALWPSESPRLTMEPDADVKSEAKGPSMSKTTCAKLQRYDGSGDVDSFLAHFEVVAKANEWTKEVQLLQLPTALDGSAFNFFCKLSVAQRNTIDKLTECLKTEYSLCFLDTDYAAQLAVRRREPGESIQDFGEAILDLSQKTYKQFSETQIDAVCRTHFINGAGDLIRVHLLVVSQEDASYRDLVKRARHLEQVLAPGARHMPAVRQLMAGESDASGGLVRLQETVTQLATTVNDLNKKVSEMAIGHQEFLCTVVGVSLLLI